MRMSTPDRLVLDTHVWKMLLDGNRFATRVLKRIDRAAGADSLYIAAITVWEIAMLVEKGVLRLNIPTLPWTTEAIHASRVVVSPLEPAVGVDAGHLPTFHGDPADRLIVATTRYLGATLVTRDTRILDYAAETKNVRVLEPT